MYFTREQNSSLTFIEKTIPHKRKDIYDVQPGTDQIRWDKESIMFNELVHQDIMVDKYDIVLSYYIVDALFKNPYIPNVVYLGGYPRKRIPLYTAFLTSCDAVIFNSLNVKKMWSQDLADSGLISNYILAKGSDKPKRSKKKSSTQKIVFAGRLIKRKGVEQLVNVFKNVSKKIPNTKLYIVGDGPEKSNLEKLVRNINLEDKVEFTGSINDTQNYFVDADLCVFPSLEGEGLMTVVAEAMMSGSCVITSNRMGNEEMVKHGKTGILVTPGSEEELEDAISECLSKPKLCSDMGRSALKFAKENLAWEGVAKQLDGILREIKGTFKEITQHPLLCRIPH